MTLLRRNSNFGSYDIAPQLQATLNANGMQAHLSQTPSGEMQLITLAHNSSTPRYYTLTQSQVENLRSGGTNSFNRKAYETFTSIVKNDYYMPNAWVTAKNANSPVNMGQWGTPSWMENMLIENPSSILSWEQNTENSIPSWIDYHCFRKEATMYDESKEDLFRFFSTGCS